MFEPPDFNRAVLSRLSASPRAQCDFQIVQLKTKAQMAGESGPDEYEDPDEEEAAVEGGPKDEL